jgi:hypothetical protein
MEAVFAMKDNVDFVVQVGEGKNKDYILPVAAIYGANAGGKSNLIRALRDAALNICERDDIRNVPFLLTDERIEEFKHSLILLINDYEYIYSYTVDGKRINEESLKRSYIGNKNPDDFDIIFERNDNTINPDSILNKGELSTIKKAANNTEYLIVNSVGTMGITGCSDIYWWCNSVLAITTIKSDMQRHRDLNTFAKVLLGENNIGKRLNKFISKFDSAISDISPFDERGDDPNDKRYILGVGHHYRRSDGLNDTMYLRTTLESNGTQKLLELYPTLIDVLDNGKTLVIDELDTMLHPLVFKRIVALFNGKATNPNKAQLIFAAHNTEIMNREDSRRDELNIVEKCSDGISSIFRLSDVVDENGKKVRMDARYDRLYLEGLLGSIPSSFQDAVV